MAYQYIHCASRGPSLLRRLALTAATALIAGLIIGGAMRTAHADQCMKGYYRQFWSPDIKAVTKTNTKLSPAESKLFIQRLKSVKTLGVNLPEDGSLIVRLLVNKETGMRLGVAIDKTGCIRGYGFVEDDFLAYLLHDAPLPERYQPPGMKV